MVVFRSVLFAVLHPLANVIWFLFCLPGLLMRRKEILAIYANPWAGFNVWLLRVVCGIETEYRGLENVPHGGCIIASKHQSELETMALATIRPDFTFILKRELMWIPFFGWYLARGEQIPINRGKRSEAVAKMRERARVAAAQGRTILIFPEGTRRPVGAEPAYKFGVALLYEATGAPCVPVGLNTGVFWKRNGFLKYPGKAIISFLPPIPPGLTREVMFAQLQDAIEAETARLVSEAQSAPPS